MTASSRPAGREAGRARTRLREVPESFDRRDTWRVVRRAGGLFRPFLGRIFAIALLVLVTSALGLAPVEFTRQVVTEGTNLAEQVANGLDRSQVSLWRINLLFLGMIAMYLSSELLGLLRGYLNQIVGQDLTVCLRASLHEHLQRLPVRFYTQTRAGEILARVTADVNAVQQAVTGTFTQFMINVTQLSMALCMMFWYDWRFGLIALLVPPLWLYPTLRVGDRMRALQLEWREENAGMTSHLAETLSVAGTMVVRTFGRQEFEASRFQRSNLALRSLSLRRFLAGRWFNVAIGLFSSMIVSFVYWYGIRGVVLGQLPDIATVIALAMLAGRIFAPYRGIARIQTTALASVALFQRIFEYLDLPVEVDEKPDALSLRKPRGQIEFEGVGFAYHEGAIPALEDISFRVEPGQMVALVGPSGAGKTTATYLIQRYYDSQRGRVLLDGHDVRDLTLDSISRSVGAVMQDTYLFHTSVLENIRYGRLEASEAEVRDAGRAAGMDDMIERLPEGLETVVGERGFRLSGGEKQRVAIARAVLKNPPVLILDEATASLDTRLEREIRESTERLARDRTTVVIAHRLSTVLAADEILVLDHGHLVERGRHDTLLAQEGLYAALYHEQFASPPKAEENSPSDAGYADAAS